MISVQFEDFSVAEEYALLSQGTDAGAVVTFVGKVRDFNQGDAVTGLSLEHYPGHDRKVTRRDCRSKLESDGLC